MSSLLSDDVVLSVRNVSKKFCRNLKRSMYYGIKDLACSVMGVQQGMNGLRKDEFRALDEVTLELRRGEGLGLVGPNGSGKSTLLRLISGIFPPDHGEIAVRGRIGALIALGAGFHPHMTGHENIHLNGTILGMTQQEIRRKLDSIVDFADIPGFMDAPVSTYSSGMRARLGFAIAVSVDPDILLVDEVLAVGDIRFRSKCYRKLAELQGKGTTFLLVAHNPQVILTVCERACYLRGGQTILDGPTAEVLDAYERDQFSDQVGQVSGSLNLPARAETESHGIDLTSVAFTDRDGGLSDPIVMGEPATLRVGFVAHRRVKRLSLNLKFTGVAADAGLALFLSNFNDRQEFDVSPGNHVAHVVLPYVGLKPGGYNLRLVARDGGTSVVDVVERFQFRVDKSSGSGDTSLSPFYQPRQWLIQNSSRTSGGDCG